MDHSDADAAAAALAYERKFRRGALVDVGHGWFRLGVGAREYEGVREIAPALPEVTDRMSESLPARSREWPHRNAWTCQD
jgi:hypothetical protein